MIEIIATTLDDCILIEIAGLGRIELISRFDLGGLTPSHALVKEAINAVRIPINVMIRPHADSFVYTNKEIEEMKQTILEFKKLGVNGVVFGVLTEDNKIDEEKLEDLLSVCDGLDVTFHRAIDDAVDKIEAIKILSKYKTITSVLTSGGRGNILSNTQIINKMIKHAGHIQVIVGGGLTFSNFKLIKENLNTRNFHFGSAVRTNDVVDTFKLEKLKYYYTYITKSTI